MYSGFNYILSDVNKFADYVSEGKRLFSEHKKIIKTELNGYLVNGILDGTKIQKDWFPKIEADIFISHSHKDETIAIGLAGWLYKNFEITAFIDSCVWGNSIELLRGIDEDHSKMDGSSDLFDYEKRNYSTSHVHMMLQTALYKIIDKVESVLVLNTDNSFKTIDTIENTIKNKTSSPWIYSEIIATTLIRKRSLSDYRIQPILEQGETFSKSFLNIEYDVELNHLIKINDAILDNWNKEYKKDSIGTNKFYYVDNVDKEKPALDYLYELVKNKQKMVAGI